MDTENTGTEVVAETGSESLDIPLSDLGLTEADIASPESLIPPDGVEAAPEAAVDTQPTAAAPAPDANPEVVRLQRQLDELRQQTEPFLRVQQQQPDPFTQRYRQLDQMIRSNQQLTQLQWLEYTEMREQMQAARLVNTARTEGTIAASESHARGIFNEKDMGAGRGYDQIVAKHITPLYERNPSLRVIEQLVPDQPGQARYLWGAMAELLERSNWDIPRAAKTLFGALEAPANAGKELAARIRQSGPTAGKIHGTETTVAPGQKKPVDNWWKVPQADFEAELNRIEYGI